MCGAELPCRAVMLSCCVGGAELPCCAAALLAVWVGLLTLLAVPAAEPHEAPE